MRTLCALVAGFFLVLGSSGCSYNLHKNSEDLTEGDNQVKVESRLGSKSCNTIKISVKDGETSKSFFVELKYTPLEEPIPNIRIEGRREKGGYYSNDGTFTCNFTQGYLNIRVYEAPAWFVNQWGESQDNEFVVYDLFSNPHYLRGDFIGETRLKLSWKGIEHTVSFEGN